MPPYPEGMGPPPRWVLDTPASSRQKAVQQFVSARQAAFTNINRGNVTHFRMSFRSRRDVNHFTFTEDARNTHLHNEIHEHHHKWKVEPDLVFGTKPHTVNKFLSITSLTNIPVRVSSDAVVDGAVNIFVRLGYFYAAIPYVARPPGLSPTCGCIACDPGLKAFLTCMHFSYIGRANWAKLDRPKQRLRDAQRCMSQFGNIKTVFRRRYNWSEGRRFVAARREFYCVSAKIKYWVDNLHYQAAAYLCKRADVILLPKFDTQSMVRESRPWSHQFNSHLATLSHYRFRRRLLDKCNLLGKSLVLCSEMYTSRTCGSCNRLHVTLRNEDVFACPHCNFRAGRDENAAFNIMRFVWGGSLSIFETTGVASRQV